MRIGSKKVPLIVQSVGTDAIEMWAQVHNYIAFKHTSLPAKGMK